MLTAAALVLGSGLLHAVWNMFTKKSINKIVFLWFTQWVSIIVFAPWFIRDVAGMTVPPAGYALVAASMALHGVYVIMLAMTYTIGDLSQVYPIMRGTSPLLVPIAGAALLGENLSGPAWFGIGLIVIGIVMLSEIRLSRNAAALPAAIPALWAFGVGVCVSGYIVVDKIALNYVSPIVLNEWGNIGNMLALSWAAIRSGGMANEWRANRKTIVLGGVIAPGGYLLFLAALTMAPVALLAPMREIGTVFGVLLGVLVLRERQGLRRFAASALITTGVLMLGWFS